MSTHNQPPQHPEDPDNAGEVSFFTILLSVVSSFFGVQKDKNRRRDFESGKFWHFFVAGLIFVIIFLVTIWGAVQYMLAITPTGN